MMPSAGAFGGGKGWNARVKNRTETGIRKIPEKNAEDDREKTEKVNPKRSIPKNGGETGERKEYVR